MKTTARLTLMIGVVLALAVILALPANQSSLAQAPTGQPYPGMGELRRFEAQQVEESRAGFGDLRRYEAQSQAPILVTGGSAGSLAVGMGNLRRFESQSSPSSSTTPQSSLPNREIKALSRSAHNGTIILVAEQASKGPGR